MTPDEIYRAAVKRCVAAAVALGASELHEILARCQGADPRLVAACVEELGATSAARRPERGTSGELFVQLPAPDPFRSQWWFTGESVAYLADRVLSTGDEGPIFSLGTPTVGHELFRDGADVLMLDVDQHVVDAVNELSDRAVAQSYDVADDLPEGLGAAFRVAVIDPPWYEDLHRVFIQRALAALVDGGELFCTLPPALTRPDAQEFSNALLGELMRGGHQLLGLERGVLRYVVPRFEEVALGGISGFRALPWRHADLLHVRKCAGASSIHAPHLEKVAIQAFTRSPQEFRVFLLPRQSIDERVVLERLEAYSSNVSTRAHSGDSPDLWTTEKVGVRIGQLEAVAAALKVWQEGARSTEEAIQQLKSCHSDAVARHVVH